MTAEQPSYVTIRTSDFGAVTIPEPSWCIGHDQQQGWRRIDITHSGPTQELTLPIGTCRVANLTTVLESRPFVSDPFLRQVFVSVEVDGYSYATGPTGLEAMADALTEQADQLREQARQLATLLREPR